MIIRTAAIVLKRMKGNKSEQGRRNTREPENKGTKTTEIVNGRVDNKFDLKTVTRIQDLE